MGTSPTGTGFRLLGFPVTVTPGFVIGLLLLGGLNAADPAFAVRLMVALAGFLLVHELGHAVVARHFGADARISLDFLVGYAIYRPSRPMRRWEQATVSLAGPGVQIAVGVSLLLALGAAPLSPSSFSGDPLATAVWWAGPALGVLNLLPVLPLDGGNVAALAVDGVAPGKGHVVLRYWTVAACALALVAVVVSPAWRPWAFTVVLFSFWSLQAVFADRRHRVASDPQRARALVAVARSAEAEAWRTGRPGLFPPGVDASPWCKAYAMHRAGKDASARLLLLQALEKGGGAWVSPETATPDQLLPLVELLPDDAPVGNPQAGRELQWALHRTGYLRRAAGYGARLYARHPLPIVAHDVACDLALLGDADGAMAWLRTAHTGATDVGLLVGDPDLASLRGRPDFAALVAEVRARGTGTPGPT
jgi:Zn-dependent protease